MCVFSLYKHPLFTSTPSDQVDTVSAVVTFESHAAAKTAVLLNNALINDRLLIIMLPFFLTHQRHHR